MKALERPITVGCVSLPAFPEAIIDAILKIRTLLMAF
jgi:hypothetical protein